jgi:hypothetical protein
VPLGLVFAVAVEHLHALVLPVGDIDQAVVVAGDVVHEVELARAGPRFAPREQQFSIGRVFVDPGILVAVGDVDVALALSRRPRLVGCT